MRRIDQKMLQDGTITFTETRFQIRRYPTGEWKSRSRPVGHSSDWTDWMPVPRDHP